MNFFGKKKALTRAHYTLDDHANDRQTNDRGVTIKQVMGVGFVLAKAHTGALSR